MTKETATEWSLRTWKERHETGEYFPASIQHANWKIYDAMPPWFDRIAQPTKRDVALEIGAGFGEWMVPLSRLVQRVAGCDIHPALTAKAVEKFREHGVDNATFVTGDGTTVPFRDGEFDLVYTISVFQHLPRSMVAGYLAESYRVLKPEGRAVHYFRNADNVGPYPPLAKDIEADHTGDFSCGWTAEEVLQAGEAAGLRCHVEDLGLHLVLLGVKRARAEWTLPGIAGRSLISPRERDAILRHIGERARVLEIGSYYGATAAYFAERRPRAEIYCIDPYEFDHTPNAAPSAAANWIRNKKAFGNMRLFTGTAAEFLEITDPGFSFDLILVDGAHYYAECTADIEAARKFGPEIIAVHDYGSCFPEVTQAADDALADWPQKEVVGLTLFARRPQ